MSKTFKEFREKLEAESGRDVWDTQPFTLALKAFTDARAGALEQVHDMVMGCTPRDPTMQKLCQAIEELMKE